MRFPTLRAVDSITKETIIFNSLLNKKRLLQFLLILSLKNSLQLGVLSFDKFIARARVRTQKAPPWLLEHKRSQCVECVTRVTDWELLWELYKKCETICYHCCCLAVALVRMVMSQMQTDRSSIMVHILGHPHSRSHAKSRIVTDQGCFRSWFPLNFRPFFLTFFFFWIPSSGFRYEQDFYPKAGSPFQNGIVTLALAHQLGPKFKLNWDTMA